MVEKPRSYDSPGDDVLRRLHQIALPVVDGRGVRRRAFEAHGGVVTAVHHVLPGEHSHVHRPCWWMGAKTVRHRTRDKQSVREF